MHDLTDATDPFLEDSVGRGIGNHQRGQPVSMLRRLGLQIGQIHIALLVAGDGDDGEPGGDRAGRVRPVGRDRDQADVALALFAMPVIGPNDHEAGIFALRAGVRLERDRREPRDLREPPLQLRAEILIAEGLLGGRERMDAAEPFPGDRDHLDSPVEFHRAGAERNHGMDQREVAGLQAMHVPEHLMFGVIPVEHLVSEILAGPCQRGRKAQVHRPDEAFHRERHRFCPGKDLEKRLDFRGGRQLIERNADRVILKPPEIHAAFIRARQDPVHGLIG